MPLFVAVIIAVAVTWAIKRGSEKLAENTRRWWSDVRSRTAASNGGRAAYDAARAGVRGAVTVGYGVGSGITAGWREGWTRAADWRDARQEARAAHDAWALMPEQHRTNPQVLDALDPLWQRGRLHGRRGQAAPDAERLPPVYRRGVDQGRADRRTAELTEEQLEQLGVIDGLRNTRPQLTSPAYLRGWRRGQEALEDPPDPAPGQPEPKQQTPTQGEDTMATNQAAAAAPNYDIGASAEVTDVATALVFARALQAEATQELDNAQAATGAAASELESNQAALLRTQAKLKALEVYETSLAVLGFGARLLTHVQQMVEATRVRCNTAQLLVEAAEHQHAAAYRWLAAAEQEQAQANALVRGLLTHSNLEEVAAGAEGGMARRQAYGGPSEGVRP